MYVPALPTITRDFGAGPSEVQLTLTTFFAGLGFGQLLAGPVSDALIKDASAAIIFGDLVVYTWSPTPRST
jgi:MFS family permease